MTTRLSTTPGAQQFSAAELHIVLEQGVLKIGTCFHCVVKESGRPDRAWEPDGDNELDFDRDQLLARLTALGVTTEIIQEYVCPKRAEARFFFGHFRSVLSSLLFVSHNGKLATWRIPWQPKPPPHRNPVPGANGRAPTDDLQHGPMN